MGMSRVATVRKRAGRRALLFGSWSIVDSPEGRNGRANAIADV
jgi:hypothetical protein